MKRLTSALLAFSLLVPFAQTAMAASAASGEKMARRWCAACHVVAKDQTTANTQAPPFSAIAKKPSFDAGKLALFLLLPHPRMPDMNMSRNEAADLAAYIASQGR